MKSMGFVLPEFFRLAWANPKAMNTWAPRVSAISAALIRLDRMKSNNLPECHYEMRRWLEERNLQDVVWGEYDVQGSVRISGPWQTNSFLREFGMFPSILPCSPGCEDTVNYVNDMVEKGKKIGVEQQMAWLKEILSWPMHWSARNGIADVKTPLFKISYSTDAVKGFHEIYLEGESFPKDGSRGNMFPFLAGKEVRHC